MKLDQPVSLWEGEISRAAEERNESEEEAWVLVKKKKGGGKKIQSSLIIIEVRNGGSAQGHLTGQELVCYFGLFLVIPDVGLAIRH